MSVPQEEAQSIGQICYEAFAASVGWKFRGAQLPGWSRLEEFERRAFTEGSERVMQKGWLQAQSAGKHKRRG